MRLKSIKVLEVFCFLLIFSTLQAQTSIERPLNNKSEIAYKTLVQGSTCSDPIPICGNYSISVMPNNSPPLPKPSCFSSFPNSSIFLAFNIIQTGQLAWKGMPNDTLTEYDWALWDISSGCPGTLVCCNYNYSGASRAGFGMQAQTGTIVCSAASSSTVVSAYKDYCPAMNVSLGEKYVLQIDNWHANGVGFSFSFINVTCLMGCPLVNSINEIIENETSIFPIPANNEILINSKSLIQSIELTNITGQVLTNVNCNQKEYNLNLVSFPEGVYFLKIIFDDKKIRYEKVIIHK